MGFLNHVKRFLKYDVIKTLYYRNSFCGNGRFHIYPNSIIKISGKADFTINNGEFRLNASWMEFRFRRYKSELILDKNSCLVIDGDFHLFQGASIYVAPGATLIIKGGWSFLNTNSTLNCFHYIEIGCGVSISDNVSIQDSDNHYIIGNEDKMKQPIIIEDHVWIGKNVTILKGVTIGEGAIVGAGSVVTKNVPPATIVVGNPAKIIRENVRWK